MQKIRGYIEYIFYPKTGMDKTKNMQFAGFHIKTLNKKRITCFGNIAYVSPGDYLEFEGEFEKKDTLKFTSALRVDDDAIGATSMLIYVLGPKTATKVMHHFADNAMTAWDVFKHHKEQFCNACESIKGIGKKKVEKAYAKYEQHVAVDVLFSRFARYGLLLNKALAVYAAWGDKSLKKMEENPYQLISIDKITFQIADKIAREYYHIKADDARRIYAGVLQVMKMNGHAGHTFIYLQDASQYNTSLLDGAEKLLHVDKVLIREEILNLIADKKLILDNFGLHDIIFLPHMHEAEAGIAKYVKEFIAINHVSDETVDNFVKTYEGKHTLKLADKQLEAIKTSVQHKFSIISGPPGSGKTTIIDVICEIFRMLKKNCIIRLAAPTGKAAKRLSESTKMQAETVHRMLKYSPVSKGFTFNETNPLSADVIIVDEFSMMSTVLTYHLLKAIPEKACLIFVGDKNQLPSVDAGKVLEDLLTVPWVPKTILNKIYRQKGDSTILQKALSLSEDIVPNLDDANDFTFWECDDVEDLKNGVYELYFNEIKQYGIGNVLLLTPMNKNELGVDTLNEVIQERYNPNNPCGREVKSGKRYFRIEDRVIQLTNEEDFSVYNGMVGTIVDIYEEDGGKEHIVVDFGDCTCDYTRDRFDNIKHAYAMTIHKCQGSEAQSVIMICHSSQKFMLRKKLIYTGMTRAKKHLHLVGQKNMISLALKNKELPRNTKLRQFLNA